MQFDFLWQSAGACIAMQSAKDTAGELQLAQQVDSGVEKAIAWESCSSGECLALCGLLLKLS